MKCNLKEIAQMSDGPCVIEGRLNYKRTSNGAIREAVFKERWFRLVKNHLFYFKLSELGKFDTRSPAGALVLENSRVHDEEAGHTIPFVFSLSFIDEPEKRHVLAARTAEGAARWVEQLRASSYEYLRSRLHLLQSQIYSISGNDPLLMVPRNEGAKLWAPSVPFSTAPACSSSSAGFSCHLHTHTHLYTLDRSRSDFYVSAHSHSVARTTPSAASPVPRAEDPAPGPGHGTRNSSRSRSSDLRADIKDNGFVVVTAEGEESTEPKREDPLRHLNSVTKDPSGFALERSKTTAFQSRLSPFDNSIFDSGLPYTRPAPSPPVRKKSSPRLHRNNTDSLLERSRCQASSSIMESMPAIPPRRKISPKCLEISQDGVGSGENIAVPASQPERTEDLIKF